MLYTLHMKLKNIFTSKKPKINQQSAVGNFARLSKAEQEKAIRKGAEKFSKDFTKVFSKLAKE